MRAALSLVGNLLFVAGLGGLVVLAAPPGRAVLEQLGRTAPLVRLVTGEPEVDPGHRSAAATAVTAEVTPIQVPDTSAQGAAGAPISHVRIPRINLDAQVVPSRLVELDGGRTWEVPAFRVGHAQYTAGAGQAGNAVLLGHVSSRNAGNVFKVLERVQLGDVVQVGGDGDSFDYVVVDVRSVPRTELSVLEPTDSASVSLITCAGAWLARLGDFSERLVVRADLSGPSN